MKVKFIFLMIILVLLITAAIVLPLTRYQILSLTNHSKDATEHNINILVNSAASNIWLYYSGTSREKRGFKTDLQDALMKTGNDWDHLLYMTIIDRNDVVLAHTEPGMIGKPFIEYKNLESFRALVDTRYNEYNIIINETPEKMNVYKSDLEKIDQKLKNASSSNKKDAVAQLEKKRAEIISLRDQAKIDEKAAQTDLKNLDKKPLVTLDDSVFLDGETSYTVIVPIIQSFGSKTQYFGSCIATISTRFIDKEIFRIMVLSGSIAAAVLLLSILIIRLYVRVIIGPISVLTDAVKNVSGGNLDMKIPVRGRDEIATLSTEFNKMIKIWRKKVTMEKFVSKSTAKMVEDLKTGEFTSEPKRKKITIFFSDVRGFTSYSENHEPMNVVTSLNKLFDIQVEIIEKHDGDIDKFVGDEIMANFPSPIAAFKAAREIQKKMDSFNKKRKEPLYIGIGINYGDAVVGSIGSGDAHDWTSIGDTVNLGARLCSAADKGKIVISESVFKRLRIKHDFEEKNIQVKGKKAKIPIYIT
jgi:class 3 adenylate cyclase/HAMP domain-containing protein